MEYQTSQSRLFGPRLAYLLVSPVVGFVYAIGLDLLAAVLGMGLPIVFLGFVVVLSIALTHFGGGIISSWVASFTAAFHILGKGSCGGLWDGSAGVAMCMPPSTMETLRLALPAAVIVGTIGYSITKVAHRRHGDPPLWVPVLYFAVPTTIAFSLLIVIDRYTALLCVVNLC